MADATPIEGVSMERDNPATIPSSYQKDSLVPSSMLASLGTAEWLTIGKNPEMSFAEVDRSVPRAQLRSIMEKKGAILPPTHEFTQTVRRISERLGVPEDTDFLVVDSEEFDAFWQPNSRTVTVTRGFGRYLIERGLDLSEEHLAAVLAHELEHAHVVGDDWVNKVNSSFLERFLNIQNHAEEYRADAEGMNRLSRAGYNPQGMIEMLRAMPLTLGRNDLGHPEQIERIRQLEDRLADDEHPLSHTEQALTPLNQEMLTWFVQDSTVYNQTEALLHSSPQSLAEALSSAETQQQFWDIYEVKRHMDKIATTKAFLSEEDQRLQNLAIKLMIYNAFCGHFDSEFVNGERINITPEINNSLVNEKGGITDEESSKLFYAGYNFSEASKITELFRTQEFRNLVAEGIQPGFSLEQASAKLEEIEKLVEIAIKGRLDLLDTSTLTEDEQKFFRGLKTCYETGTASEDLYLILYSSIDQKLQRAKQEESAKDSSEKGLRAPEESRISLRDLRAPHEQDAILNLMKFSLAHHFVGDPQVSDETIARLASTIAHDTGLDNQEVEILANTILKGEKGYDWANYLKDQDKEALKRIIYGVKNLDDTGAELLFSPLRSLHSSFRTSKSGEYLPSYADGTLFGIDAGGLKVLKMLAARELYLRGYPPGFEYSFRHKLPPAQINLTMEEWDLAVEGQANYSTSTERGEWALVRYIEQIQRGESIDPNFAEYVRKWGVASYDTNLSVEQIKIMMTHSVWNVNELQNLLDRVLINWFEKKKYPDGAPSNVMERDNKTPDLPEQDRKEILDVLKRAYVVFRNTGENGKGLREASKVASWYMDVLSQDITTPGVNAKDASLQALKQMVTEGILLDYLSISKEGISNIGDFTAEDINSLLQILKSTNVDDIYKQNLIETFQILEVTSQEDRKEVAKKPIGEISIRAILSKYGEDSLNWVTTHFQKSDLRDIILIGLCEFAAEEFKDRFNSEIWNHLTETPDKFHGKQNSVFPFVSYYRDVKIDKDPQDRYLGQGKLTENFPDLVKRRNPFATTAFIPENTSAVLYDRYASLSERYGSIYQWYIATRLINNESIIFNQGLPFNQRVESLTQAAPFHSVVRDIHLELFAQDEFRRSTSDAEKVEKGRVLFPLFTEKSALKDQLAVQLIRAELSTTPQLKKDFEGFINLVTYYLPQPTLARNYFLNQLENNVALTPDQLKRLSDMRISPQGKKEEGDSAPLTFVMDKLGELNREERAKAALWLLGFSPEKPKAIREIELRFDGHLDSLPPTIAMSTDDEKEVTFKRLLLGAEGIVDLETVNPAQLEVATLQRKEFIRTLAENLLPDSMPRVGLFRNVFSTIIESSDPSHASRILVKLINKLTTAQSQGKQLPPEEVVALGLNELGVVGKKVSQSLAELDWVPDAYKQTLRKSQTEGEVVPKRALYILAEDAGLLKDDSSIRVVSFDELIGAASNKQACLVTVEVNDESVGLPKGRHQIVGKFKRPSAQKTENLNHDLRILQEIITILNREGYADALPRDFTAQISTAVRKELDFSQEKEFSSQIRPDLEERNSRRRNKVTIPSIYFASDDVMLESRASGISLRNYQDLKKDDPSQLRSEGYGAINEREMNQTIVSEALAQLITTGNIHADLHPGNIFVDQQANLTFIDLGMHERLTTKQRLDTVSLVAGLITGNETFVKRVLNNFGWNVGDSKLGLQRLNLTENTTQLLRATQRSEARPPEVLSSIILATSKLTTYSSGLSNAELFRILAATVNRRELPAILIRLIQSGGRELLR